MWNTTPPVRCSLIAYRRMTNDMFSFPVRVSGDHVNEGVASLQRFRERSLPAECGDHKSDRCGRPQADEAFGIHH